MEGTDILLISLGSFTLAAFFLLPLTIRCARHCTKNGTKQSKVSSRANVAVLPKATPNKKEYVRYKDGEDSSSSNHREGVKIPPQIDTTTLANANHNSNSADNTTPKTADGSTPPSSPDFELSPGTNAISKSRQNLNNAEKKEKQLACLQKVKHLAQALAPSSSPQSTLTGPDATMNDEGACVKELDSVLDSFTESCIFEENSKNGPEPIYAISKRFRECVQNDTTDKSIAGTERDIIDNNSITERAMSCISSICTKDMVIQAVLKTLAPSQQEGKFRNKEDHQQQTMQNMEILHDLEACIEQREQLEIEHSPLQIEMCRLSVTNQENVDASFHMSSKQQAHNKTRDNGDDDGTFLLNGREKSDKFQQERKSKSPPPPAPPLLTSTKSLRIRAFLFISSTMYASLSNNLLLFLIASYTSTNQLIAYGISNSLVHIVTTGVTQAINTMMLSLIKHAKMEKDKEKQQRCYAQSEILITGIIMNVLYTVVALTVLIVFMKDIITMLGDIHKENVETIIDLTKQYLMFSSVYYVGNAIRIPIMNTIEVSIPNGETITASISTVDINIKMMGVFSVIIFAEKSIMGVGFCLSIVEMALLIASVGILVKFSKSKKNHDDGNGKCFCALIKDAFGNQYKNFFKQLPTSILTHTLHLTNQTDILLLFTLSFDAHYIAAWIILSTACETLCSFVSSIAEIAASNILFRIAEIVAIGLPPPTSSSAKQRIQQKYLAVTVIITLAASALFTSPLGDSYVASFTNDSTVLSVIFEENLLSFFAIHYLPTALSTLAFSILSCSAFMYSRNNLRKKVGFIKSANWGVCLVVSYVTVFKLGYWLQGPITGMGCGMVVEAYLLWFIVFTRNDVACLSVEEEQEEMCDLEEQKKYKENKARKGFDINGVRHQNSWDSRNYEYDDVKEEEEKYEENYKPQSTTNRGLDFSSPKSSNIANHMTKDEGLSPAIYKQFMPGTGEAATIVEARENIVERQVQQDKRSHDFSSLWKQDSLLSDSSSSSPSESLPSFCSSSSSHSDIKPDKETNSSLNKEPNHATTDNYNTTNFNKNIKHNNVDSSFNASSPPSSSSSVSSASSSTINNSDNQRTNETNHEQNYTKTNRNNTTNLHKNFIKYNSSTDEFSKATPKEIIPPPTVTTTIHNERLAEDIIPPITIRNKIPHSETTTKHDVNSNRQISNCDIQSVGNDSQCATAETNSGKYETGEGFYPPFQNHGNHGDEDDNSYQPSKQSITSSQEHDLYSTVSCSRKPNIRVWEEDSEVKSRVYIGGDQYYNEEDTSNGIVDLGRMESNPVFGALGHIDTDESFEEQKSRMDDTRKEEDDCKEKEEEDSDTDNDRLLYILNQNVASSEDNDGNGNDDEYEGDIAETTVLPTTNIKASREIINELSSNEDEEEHVDDKSASSYMQDHENEGDHASIGVGPLQLAQHTSTSHTGWWAGEDPIIRFTPQDEEESTD